MTDQTIYEMLGSEQLRKMVDSFYDHVVADERISHLFTTDMEVVREKQFLFLTQYFGGPQLYIQKFGHPRMRMRHLPHKIDEAAAIAWLQNMKKAIDSLDIDQQLKVTIFNCFPKLAGHMINS